MIKKTITYDDYNGVERTENFYFNLTEAEIMEMELGTTGGLSTMMTEIVAAKDTPTIISLFKDLILKSYGEKSPDGKRFIKSPELANGFAQTEAYSQLFMELATETEKAIAFTNGIMPQKTLAKLEKKKSELAIDTEQ